MYYFIIKMHKMTWRPEAIQVAKKLAKKDSNKCKNLLPPFGAKIPIFHFFFFFFFFFFFNDLHTYWSTFILNINQQDLGNLNYNSMYKSQRVVNFIFLIIIPNWTTIVLVINRIALKETTAYKQLNHPTLF